MKMITEVPGVDNMLAHINNLLPPQIRLWDFVGTTCRTECTDCIETFLSSGLKALLMLGRELISKFDVFVDLPPVYRHCDSRKYTYFFPSYLLIPPKPASGLDRALKAHAASLSFEVTYSDDSFWNVPDAVTSTDEEDLVRKRAWRATPAHIEHLREIVKKFEKTHNFHNFTLTMNPTDKTNNRFMKSLEVHISSGYGIIGDTNKRFDLRY
jgi:tRNA pseudouridine38-40 synthase